MDDLLRSLSPALPLAAPLAGGLLVGLLALILWQRRQPAGADGSAAIPGGEAPAGDGDQAGPKGAPTVEASALRGTARVIAAAWEMHAVWARSGLVLELWGARSGPADPRSAGRHGAGPIQRVSSRAGAHTMGQPTARAAAPVMDLYVRGEAAHVRAAADLAPEFGARLGGEASVVSQGVDLAAIRVQGDQRMLGQREPGGSSLWRQGLRARTLLAPLGQAASAPDAVQMAVYGEVQRGLLVAIESEDNRARASTALLAATVGLLAGLPEGSVELFLAVDPLSPLHALSTAPALAEEPTSPARADLLGGLLDRIMDDDRPEALRRRRVVVLDHALRVLAGSPALCARLETALAQGPARGLAVLASTVMSRDLPEGIFTAFACRLLLGPCAAGAGAMLERAVARGVTLPTLGQAEALWVDCRAGTGSRCLPLSIEREDAAALLGIAPAALDLPGNTSDRPRVGRTLLVLRLLGGLSATTPEGQSLGTAGGMTPRQAEALAFLATRWGQAVPAAEVPPALHAVMESARAALARALPHGAGSPRPDVLAIGQGGEITLISEVVWVDSMAFAGLCGLAEAASGAGERLAILERALPLYEGDFLGQATPSWAEGERTRLRALYVGALRTAAELTSAAGNHAGAALYADRLRQVAGMEDESAMCLCLRVQCAAGNQAGVEEAFRVYQAALAAQSAKQPAPAVSALYRELMSSLTGKDRTVPVTMPRQVDTAMAAMGGHTRGPTRIAWEERDQ